MLVDGAPRASKTREAAGAASARRDDVTATLLPNGKVLVYGGIYPGRTSSAELYDPATGAWTATGDLARPGTVYQTATLLSDGTVLLAGGGNQTNTAELYDPAKASWTTTATMLGGHVAVGTLLLDGTVLVAGGRDCHDEECQTTGSAELYVPAGVSPPTSLPTAPPPTPRPTPTPIPTPFPPQAGPIPSGARLWTVTVVNQSSKPATLFVANEEGRGTMAQLVGSATPNVVPAGATVRVTFAIPAKGVKGWSIWVNPGPDMGGLVGESDVPRVPRPLEIHINEGGQPSYGQPSSG